MRVLPPGAFVCLCLAPLSLYPPCSSFLPLSLTCSCHTHLYPACYCLLRVHQDGWGCTYDQTLDDPTWTPQQRALLLGGETAMWGEGINADNADAYIWRGAAAAAERLWSPLALTPSHGLAAGRFAEHLCRLQTLGVKAGPIAPGFCPADAGAPASSSSSSLALAARAIKAAAREAAGAGQALTLTSEQASVLAAVL